MTRFRVRFRPDVREQIIREMVFNTELREIFPFTVDERDREAGIRSMLVRFEGGHQARSDLEDVLFRLLDHIARKLPEDAKEIPT